MQTEEQVMARLVELEKDERIHYPVARVDVNAPLALIQIALVTEAQALRRILELKPRKYYGED